MSDRAQLGPTPRWPMTIVVVVLIAILIVTDIRQHVGAADFSQVEHVCGLCGTGWPPSAQLLVIALPITAVVFVALAVARSGVAPTVFSGGDDE